MSLTKIQSTVDAVVKSGSSHFWLLTEVLCMELNWVHIHAETKADARWLSILDPVLVAYALMEVTDPSWCQNSALPPPRNRAEQEIDDTIQGLVTATLGTNSVNHSAVVGWLIEDLNAYRRKASEVAGEQWFWHLTPHQIATRLREMTSDVNEDVRPSPFDGIIHLREVPLE